MVVVVVQVARGNAWISLTAVLFTHLALIMPSQSPNSSMMSEVRCRRSEKMLFLRDRVMILSINKEDDGKGGYRGHMNKWLLYTVEISQSCQDRG